MAVSCLGALNGWTLLQGEVPLAMARAGELPRWLAGTNAKGTPVRGLVLSTILASLLLVANSLQGLVALFTAMALLATSATLWLYVGCALASLRFRLARGRVPLRAFLASLDDGDNVATPRRTRHNCRSLGGRLLLAR